jgi:hypothetical protein
MKSAVRRAVDNVPGIPGIFSDCTFSPSLVRYFDGQIHLPNTDLSSFGFGSAWS